MKIWGQFHTNGRLNDIILNYMSEKGFPSQFLKYKACLSQTLKALQNLFNIKAHRLDFVMMISFNM